ncbi:MAG: sulfatase-like hydrolase/transferase [Candidatus Omnitrophica bacterium]|nr:sulfatase-like hydrolase/transferase [Candidatus Omnitrophota bacterium]
MSMLKNALIASILTLLTPTLYAQENAVSADKRPNVLFIMGDQHRYDCLGVAGNPDVKTPNLDSIAEDGVHYSNTYCSYPVCTPARYSLLSGVPVHEHCGWSNHATPCEGTPMYPRILRENGYRTKAVGKMHFTPTYLDLGFSEMLLAEQNGPGRWDDDYHRYLKAEGLTDVNDLEDQERNYRDEARDNYWETFGALTSNLPEEYHSTTWIGDRAVEDLATWEGGGNLLKVSFIKPHHPFDPPEPWDKMYDPKALTILPGWTGECFERDLARGRGYFHNDTLTKEALKRCMAYYYATISQIDHQIGRMIQTLKDNGLYDNTLILYTSDHGEYLGYHHLLLKGNYMYEPVVRIPLVIKYPNSDRKGEESTQFVSNVDLAPTILKACGFDPAPEMEGVDLGKNSKGHDKIFVEQGPYDVMVRDRRYKLIHTDQKDRVSMFFDLEKDPLEMVDLYDDQEYAEKIAEFEQAIQDWRGVDTFKNHVDEFAPVIDQPNVPDRGDGHREEMQKYFAEGMKKKE